MKKASPKSRLPSELRRLFRSMDFVSRHPALEKGGAEGARFAEIYQQLGLAWEFLARKCGHEDGFRKARDGRAKCAICGTFEDAATAPAVLPEQGDKRIGRRLVPDSAETFAKKKAATLLDDAIVFHGAKLRVIVQNAYRSKLLGKMDVTIAADRMVRLEEGGVECGIDTHTIRLRLSPRKKGEAPPRAGFPWELSRAQLKRFPVLLESGEDGEFAGVTIFKPLQRAAASGGKKPKPRKRS